MQSIVILLALCLVAPALFFALKGVHLSSQPWLPWITKAGLAAGLAFVVGILLLGLPGAILVEAVTSLGLKLPPDAVWPLAIWITQVGALMIVPASLVVRLTKTGLAGWQHARATAMLTVAASFLLTLMSTLVFGAICSMSRSGC